MRRFMPDDPMPLYAATRKRRADTNKKWKAMTSKERRDSRYLRRKAKRDARKAPAAEAFDDFERVFSYENLYESYRKCRRNVAWKGSVQKYITQAPLMVYETHTRLLSGKWKSKGFYEFDVNERGKTRHIRSVNFDERVVQRCLCDHALVPMLGKTFIYDNAASLENRGYHFALRRLERHLKEHYRKHGVDGYVLLFDFRKYFDSIPHGLCKDILRKAFRDERILRLSDHFLDAFGDKGLGLGSQISQTLALAAANRIDHYVKDACGIRGYGRYMDDGYVIHKDKDMLFKILGDIRALCQKLGLSLNEKKTQIVKLGHGFTFLQARVYILPSGRILKKIPRKSVTRERRRLKKMAGLVEAGAMAYADAYTSFLSWRAYARNFQAYRTILEMSELFDSLFIWPWAGVAKGPPQKATEGGGKGTYHVENDSERPDGDSARGGGDPAALCRKLRGA